MSMALVGPDPEGGGFFRRRVDRLRTSVRRSGLIRTTTGKVIVFAVACLAVLGLLVAKVGNISFFSNRVQYQAELVDATGLQPSDDVKIAGVTVGVVDGIAVHRGHAVVRFSVNRSVRLPSDTNVGLQWQNVLGDEYLYLYPGHSGTRLQPGGTITLSHDESSADIGALLNALGPVLGSIHPQQANEVVVALANALEGNETEIDNLINSAATVSDTVGSVDSQIGQVITNLNQVFSALAQRSSDLGTLIDNLQTVSSSLASNNALVDQTVSNLGTVAGEVATLVSQTHGTLSGAIDNLQGVTGTIEQNDQALAKGLSGIGTGLAPYTEISSYGQWFQVQGIYTCLAGEAVCTYYDPTNPPKGSGVGGGAPVPLPSLFNPLTQGVGGTSGGGAGAGGSRAGGAGQ